MFESNSIIKMFVNGLETKQRKIKIYESINGYDQNHNFLLSSLCFKDKYLLRMRILRKQTTWIV